MRVDTSSSAFYTTSESIAKCTCCTNKGHT